MDLVMSFVSLLVCIVSFLDDIGHLLSFLMKLLLQLLIQIIKNNPLPPKAVNQPFQILIISRSLIKLLISLIKPILQYLDLLLQIIFVLGPRVHAHTVFPFLSYFFLEIADMDIDAFLGFLLVVDCCVDFLDYLLF